MKQNYKKIILIVIIIVLMGWAVLYSEQNPKVPVNLNASATPSSENITIKKGVDHVVIVLEENHRYKSVIGNTRDMPYLNGLATIYAYSKNYFANTHPSIGNYFMLTTGNIITNNDDQTSTVTDDNIVRHLIAAGKTWKEYSESLPSAGYTGGDANPYKEHHNPLSYFSDVRGQSSQEANLVPIEQFAADIANHALPNFSFVVPNNFHNAHDCPNGSGCTDSQKLKSADEWLKTNIDPLLKNPDFDAPGGGILIVVFDEASMLDKNGGGGQVAWVAAGPDIKKGYSSDTRYQHENTLRFMAEALGLSDFPGQAANAANMAEFVNQ